MAEILLRWSPQFSSPVPRRWLILGSIFAAAILVSWLILSYAVARRLTQRNRPPFPEPIPAVSWGKFEPIRLKTRDGQELGAWLAEGDDEEAPTVLMLHGNGASRSASLGRASIWASEGFSVLLVSLRAHGDSSGEFNDIGYGARNDVIAAVDFLDKRRPGRRVIIHGKSLGAAAATFASRQLAHRVAGYFLESPYQDLKKAVRNRTENSLPPVLDWIAYRGLLLVAPFILPELEKIAPVEAIGGIPADVPVWILAGGKDRSARPEEARALFDRVRSHGKLVLFERGAHMNFPEVEPERYRQVLLSFLQPFRPQPE
jgi:alpha-beta hydrolase superfamily lysophospholipase